MWCWHLWSVVMWEKGGQLWRLMKQEVDPVKLRCLFARASEVMNFLPPWNNSLTWTKVNELACTELNLVSGWFHQIRSTLVPQIFYSWCCWLATHSNGYDTNLPFIVLLARCPVVMSQWCQVGPSNLLFITNINKGLACLNIISKTRGDFSLKVP